MLYWLSDYSDKLQFFNLFRYITWRTGGALMTAAVFMFIAGSPIIDWLRAAQGKGQPIRTDGPQSHLKSKIGTPTMGGLMIIFAVTASTMLWANPANPYVWIVLGVTLAFGVIGFYDDYLKVTKQQAYTSFSGKLRLTAETIVAILACLAISQLGRPGLATSLTFPFFKDLIVDLELVLHRVRGLHHRRRRQCRESDRRSRWSRHCAGHHRRAQLRTDCLSRRQCACSPTICRSTTSPAPASSRYCAER